ncbi:hypothetical protein AVEN_209775-1 [Araneus ventricosus]|uniref:Reverse transcriptase domain-containing protein n=1 Tax=Araneus ventricosus TaxID=182803 RepID=A0A4Y2W1E6_ARAVE|nr:hypothetical protein AVEN_209775-1 [Araneus ventricosus]
MRKPHTILVYPAKDSSEATSVEEILKNTIRPEANVKIREFTKVKNQGVAVSCDSVKDIQSIISRLDGDNSAKEKVSHRMPGKRHPNIILYDLPNTITDQEVQEALRTYTEDGENLRTRFKLKGRKPDTSYWVMAPRQHFLQLKRFRKIAVNWNMFQIKEFFHVKRCQFCQAFGHTRQNCKYTVPNCGICADRHSTSYCRSNFQLCINCEESNRNSATPPVSFNKVSSTCLKTLKVLQINLGRTKAANDTLHPTSDKLQSDLLLLQEPYIYDSQIKGIPHSWNIFSSISNKAAVIIPSRQLHAALISCKQNTVAVKIQTGQQPTTFISAYSSPYSNIQETLLEIQEIISSLPRENIFIGADLNDHNTLWGYSDVDSRGTAIEEFILANNLFINNSSDAPPTFTRNSSKGWPDLSLCTQQMIGEIANWKVLEEPSLSDHHYIAITIDSSVKNCTFTRNSQNEKDINEATNLLQNCVIEACNKSYRTKNQNLSPTPNWYTQDLEIEKNRLKALRRRAQRAPQDQRNARFQFHKEELKKFMRKVKTAKNSGWKSFCTIATNPYGAHYKAAFRKAIKPAELIALNNHDPSGNHLKIAQDILEKIFPHPANSNSSTYIPPCTAIDCPFTKGEVATVIHHLSKGKAPGPDGTDQQKWPSRNSWIPSTRGRQVVITYWCFRSTLRVPLTIFSTAQFHLTLTIVNAQQTVNIFKNLLQNRKVILNSCEGPAIRDQKQGCPQGSCSGPSLWNLVVNEILQENWPINTSIQAFADDFVLVSHAPTRVQLGSQINESIAKFSTWTSKNQLQISAEKTNYLLISKLVRGPTIRWQGERIKRAHPIKYLGIYIDEKMNWNTHLKAQSTRATQLYHNLLKIAGKS